MNAPPPRKHGPGYFDRPYLSRPQVRLVLRIYWMDKWTRRLNGYRHATFGLRRRLAAEFGVPEETIKEITRTGDRHHRRGTFLDIDLEKEKELAKRRLKNRATRYRS